VVFSRTPKFQNLSSDWSFFDPEKTQNRRVPETLFSGVSDLLDFGVSGPSENPQIRGQIWGPRNPFSGGFGTPEIAPGYPYQRLINCTALFKFEI
jgi:hypothetical protein